jgi:hypothetical protein
MIEKNSQAISKRKNKWAIKIVNIRTQIIQIIIIIIIIIIQ